MAWRQHSIPRSGQSQGGVPGANIEARAHEVPGTLHTPALHAPSVRRPDLSCAARCALCKLKIHTSSNLIGCPVQVWEKVEHRLFNFVDRARNDNLLDAALALSQDAGVEEMSAEQRHAYLLRMYSDEDKAKQTGSAGKSLFVAPFGDHFLSSLAQLPGAGLFAASDGSQEQAETLPSTAPKNAHRNWGWAENFATPRSPRRTEKGGSARGWVVQKDGRVAGIRKPSSDSAHAPSASYRQAVEKEGGGRSAACTSELDAYDPRLSMDKAGVQRSREVGREGGRWRDDVNEGGISGRALFFEDIGDSASTVKSNEVREIHAALSDLKKFQRKPISESQRKGKSRWEQALYMGVNGGAPFTVAERAAGVPEFKGKASRR